MPVGKGVFKADDYYHFGKLVAKLEELGAYYIGYSPKKSAVFAWFRGGPENGQAALAIKWLGDNGYEYEVSLGGNANFTMIAIRW